MIQRHKTRIKFRSGQMKNMKNKGFPTKAHLNITYSKVTNILVHNSHLTTYYFSVTVTDYNYIYFVSNHM